MEKPTPPKDEGGPTRSPRSSLLGRSLHAAKGASGEEEPLAALQVTVARRILECESREELLAQLRDLESKLSNKQLASKRRVPDTWALKIIHFNDVYNIENAPKFVNEVLEHKESGSKFDGREPLVLFSGDAFNPSMISITARGKQMVPILNLLGVDCALFGNHDFDHSLAQTEVLVNQCKFPWIMSNCIFKPTGKPLGNGREYHIIDTKVGVRVGVLGLVEWGWMETLTTISPEDLVYEDFCACANRVGKKLRQEESCDVVIALTHMRWPNDEKLALSGCGSVDLVLGGHDHDYGVQAFGRVQVVKSGTDFRDFSIIYMSCSPVCVQEGAAEPSKCVSVDHIERVTINPSWPEDQHAVEVVQRFGKKVIADMARVIGETSVALEGRFEKIRGEETNLANFIADVVRAVYHCDAALFNAGTLRADSVIGPGNITLGDLRSILPMADETVVLRLSGSQLLEALENGVSKHGQGEGRWPCVSGITFEFDPRKPPMSRIQASSVHIGLDALNLNQYYTLATKQYLALSRSSQRAAGRAQVPPQESYCCSRR